MSVRVSGRFGAKQGGTAGLYPVPAEMQGQVFYYPNYINSRSEDKYDYNSAHQTMADAWHPFTPYCRFQLILPIIDHNVGMDTIR